MIFLTRVSQLVIGISKMKLIITLRMERPWANIRRKFKQSLLTSGSDMGETGRK
jgi:hypothetical protein